MLRDDVETLFTNVLELNKNKLDFLEKLQILESNNLHFNRTDQLEPLEDSISEINNIIDEINLIDYDTSAIGDEICSISGIDREQLADMVNKTGHE